MDIRRLPQQQRSASLLCILSWIRRRHGLHDTIEVLLMTTTTAEVKCISQSRRDEIMRRDIGEGKRERESVCVIERSRSVTLRHFSIKKDKQYHNRQVRYPQVCLSRPMSQEEPSRRLSDVGRLSDNSCLSYVRRGSQQYQTVRVCWR
jgi:hypothetical protein